jgi:hypothetical protein
MLANRRVTDFAVIHMCFIEGAGIASDEMVSTLHVSHHTQESAEKKFAAVTISLVILGSVGATAQGKTRADVDQELGSKRSNTD